ncbi:MAG: hypothetical protein AAGA85_05820, partial [Bacteroidota bacterium]
RLRTGYDIFVSNMTRGGIEVSLGILPDPVLLTPGDTVRSGGVYFPSLDGDSPYFGRLIVNYLDTIDGFARETEIFSDFSVPYSRLQRKQIFITAPDDTTSTPGVDPGTGFNITLDDQPLVVGDSIFIGG